MDPFSILMGLGFLTQAAKLYPKRGMDWLVTANIAFSAAYFVSSFNLKLGIAVSAITIAAFVRPAEDKTRDFRFRLAHLAVIAVACVYLIHCLMTAKG